ncbi:MAG: hypothetical protein JW819_03900 [Candidatus Krumholzibacteriota bacterium]|nr:hypothetical protein [Candidatus Krumholzibacteriota bacterium]
MKKLMIAILMLSLAVGVALAKTPPEKPLVPFQGEIRATEVEPNDDCGTATVVLAGDPMLASINPIGDVDWFEFTIAEDGCYNFETAPGEGQSGGDTQMHLYADDCVTEVAYDDDGGEGLYSMFQVNLTAGTYFVYVNEYGNNGVIDAYVLTVDPCPEPPENDTCEGAILLPEGDSFYQVDLCAATNDYSPLSGGCTGYTANGPDVVYYVDLLPGGTISACENPTGGAYIDLAIYLITDCENVDATCVAGDDSGNPECIDYASVDGGRYYLIVDTYSGCGDVDITVNVFNSTPVQSSSWSTVKALY